MDWHKEINGYIAVNCPEVGKLKKQPNALQCDDLAKNYTWDEIKNQLNAMENYKPLASKYTSVYLTMVKWFKLDAERFASKLGNQRFADPSRIPEKLTQFPIPADPYATQKKMFFAMHPVGSHFTDAKGRKFTVESETFLRESGSDCLLPITSILRSI